MKITTALEGVILQLTQEQLRDLLQAVPQTHPAGLFRASVDALRGAVRTYLRMDRLTEAQLLGAKHV